MLKNIIAFSLKNRMFVVVTAFMVAIVGTYISTQMPKDVLPDLNRPTVVVMTEAHGMVPDDIEKLVTLPLEQVLNGVTGVERVRSSSGLGMSVIKVEFGWNTDIYRNRQIVAEKLQLAKSKLPPGVIPQMAPISSIMGQIQLVGVTSKSGKTSPEELRSLVDYQLKYELLSIPGVSKVIAAGGSPKQLQVIMDAEKLRSFGVTVEEVAEAVHGSNMNESAGFLNIGTKAPMITVNGLLKNKEELEQAVVLANPDRSVTIADVAEVKFGPAGIKTGEAGVDGEAGVIMIILKQPGFDTIKMTEKIDKTLNDMKAGLGEDIVIKPHLFSQAEFIHRGLDNVFEAVRDGGIMVCLVLFIFLMNWRTTFITLTAIPLSIAVTAIVFAIFGLSINTMTLGGLAVAIGALVDDAIVDVENCFRRLRQNRLLPEDKRKSPLVIVFDASCEVRNPIVIGTMLVVIVYIPLFFLSGMAGKLFVPIGIAYIISVSASLLISLTLTVSLCYYMLPNHLGKEGLKDTWAVRNLKIVAGAMISFSLKRAHLVLYSLVILVVIGVLALMNIGYNFLPSFNEGTAQINIVLPPDTGLDTSVEFGRKAEKVFKSIKGVKYVSRRTGRAEGDEHAHGVNQSDCIITFDESVDRSREEIIGEIRQKLKYELPGVGVAVGQPLEHLISSMLSGAKTDVAIKIYGENMEKLRSLAKEVEAAASHVNGVKDLMVEQQVLVPTISVVPNRELLKRHGLTVEQVNETVGLSLGSESVSRMIKGRYSFPIIVRLKPEDRKNMKDVENIYIRKENGDLIRLKDVADVKMSLISNNIKHENIGRRISVEFNVAERSLGEVVEDVDDAIAPIKERLADESQGYYIKISGQYEAQQEANRKILILSIFSLGAMIFILYLHFQSVNLSLQVLASIPMAFIGAAAYIILSRQTMSVATLVGLISLAGIASRNAILLLDHYLHLAMKENVPFGKELIIQGGKERMIPVVMTALTSGIALIPLALSPGEPGKEILYPVATVIIGGLLSSTLLNFVVSPAAFWVFGKKAVEHKIRTMNDEKEENLMHEMEDNLELMDN